MKVIVLLLVCLSVCQSLDLKEGLETSQDCTDDMRGNKQCDAVCNKKEYKYDNGDCCEHNGLRWNGASCVAKTNGLYNY